MAATVDWYEEQRQGLGGELLDAIEDAIAGLLEHDTSIPVPGCPPGLPVRRVFVERFPYTLVLVESGDEILIIAVAHLRRRPGYWKARIR